ncbi:uncharacterized protein LOC114574811 [Exaiptasia diaphana]|uniref:C-type lectin domain-containing protein n=1 Tax=Exaiptasia diaphana TaxID=2652724 RepID=A0A913YII4_EXADI|nr:uncharacterized protein LOC114574811 [Exaiptasia diaphana]
MEMGLTRALLCILLLQGKLWLISCLAHCSCYTFHDTNRNRWAESNQDCETRNGTLVSMETEDEWNFITSEIQKINSTANINNDWFIGLSIARKELEKYNSLEDKRKAGWSWTSGQKLTINSKWQRNEPNNRGRYDDYCVVISKNWPKGKYGFIKDVNCFFQHPYICEYDAGNKVNTSLNPVCWSNSSSKIRLTSCTEVNIPTTVITTTTSKIDATTTLPVQVYSIERTTAITTTQSK